MEMDWKASIGEYFTQNGIHRVAFLNNKLESYCEEYAKYLNEYYGVRVKFERHYTRGEDICGQSMTILIRTENKEFKPFKLFCKYNTYGNLELKTSIDYEYLLFPTEAEIKSGDKWAYDEEEHSEPEVFEKEYLFELFTCKLKDYIAVLNAKS
jgi:hypothetical protein